MDLLEAHMLIGKIVELEWNDPHGLSGRGSAIALIELIDQTDKQAYLVSDEGLGFRVDSVRYVRTYSKEEHDEMMSHFR